MGRKESNQTNKTNSLSEIRWKILVYWLMMDLKILIFYKFYPFDISQKHNNTICFLFQASQWANARNLPGQFIGSTGANIMTQEELIGPDKKRQAWLKKVLFCSLLITIQLIWSWLALTCKFLWLVEYWQTDIKIKILFFFFVEFSKS